MSKEFEIVREFEVEATPEQVWEAITTGTAGWLWPMEYEPREGGAAPFGGTVAAWDPPRHLTARVEDAEGISVQTLNQLEYVIEPREGGSWVRFVHSGIFVDDWDNQYDGASKHNDFYLHTLRQYLVHFPGRAAAYSAADGPAASSGTGSFDTVRRALGLSGGTAEGAAVRVELPALAPFDAVVDYHNEYFIGLRTGDTLYRFFGRDAFGAPVGIAVHQFAAGADPERTEAVWQEWMAGLFA
jgi:uncharacterized protein YndB with AHSA1/START domain